MLDTFFVPATLILGATVWMAVSYVRRELATRRCRDIAARGESCVGRIVAIQRPRMFDACTRLYFEFAPPGLPRPLLCCHVEQRGVEELPCEVLSTGMLVKIRYLPERPQEAVIGRLVSP